MPDVVGRRLAHHRDDLVAGGERLLHDLTADAAGRAENRDLHPVPSFMSAAIHIIRES
jgi:hypothetical protein